MEDIPILKEVREYLLTRYVVSVEYFNSAYDYSIQWKNPSLDNISEVTPFSIKYIRAKGDASSASISHNSAAFKILRALQIDPSNYQSIEFIMSSKYNSDSETYTGYIANIIIECSERIEEPKEV